LISTSLDQVKNTLFSINPPPNKNSMTSFSVFLFFFYNFCKSAYQCPLQPPFFFLSLLSIFCLNLHLFLLFSLLYTHPFFLLSFPFPVCDIHSSRYFLSPFLSFVHSSHLFSRPICFVILLYIRLLYLIPLYPSPLYTCPICFL